MTSIFYKDDDEPTPPGATVENEVEQAAAAAESGNTQEEYLHLSNAAFMLNVPSGDVVQHAEIEARLAEIRESW